jgi:hypothetical protein
MTSARCATRSAASSSRQEIAALLLIGYQPSPLAAVRRTARNASA